MNPAGQRHIPVLGRQAVGMLQPRAGGIYVDATFGAGGYSRTILDTAGTRVIGIDPDSIWSIDRTAGSRWSRTGFPILPKFAPRRASTRSMAW